MPQGWTPGPAPRSDGWTPGPASERPPDFRATNNPPSPELQREAADPNTIGTLIRNWWQTVNPVQLGQVLPFPKAWGGSGMDHPITQVLPAMQAVKREADERWEKGDRVGASAKYVESLIPILGPMMSEAGNRLERGEVAAVGGQVLGALTPAALTALPKIPVKTPALVKPQLTAPEAAAVKFGQQQGVPIDAATATGNRFVLGAQKIADESLIGSGVGGRARQAQATALTKTGERLAERALPTAATTEQAGQNLVASLQSKIDAHQALVKNSYEALDAMAADPRHVRQVRIRTPETGGQTATVQMPLPVDLRATKQALTPIYQQLERQYPLTRQQSSAGFKALENIVKGPDYGPLSQVDRDLSALKKLAREEGGVAKLAVANMDAAVRATAARAGTQAMRLLERGRGAVKARVATEELLENFRAEPVQAYRQLVAPKDSGIALLRTVAKETPQALPRVARAYLDDLLNTATEAGGFGHADKLYAQWQKLGSETKKLLFPQAGQTQALDHFFLLAKRIAENPNPPGSGLTVAKGSELGALFTQPLIGIPASVTLGTASKLLHSPAGVRALTRGLQLTLDPSKATPAAAAAVTANLLKLAQQTGADTSAPAPPPQ